MVVGRSDSASGERRGSAGVGEERFSVVADGACDVTDGSASEGEGGVVEEPDHHEDQDDEVLVAAGGVLDASAECCCEGGCCVEEDRWSVAFLALRSSPASSSRNFVISGSVSGDDAEGCCGCAAEGASVELCDAAGFSGADLPQSQPIVLHVGSGWCRVG